MRKRQRVFSIEQLLEMHDDFDIPVYVDSTSYKAFETWSEENMNLLYSCALKGLRFWVFAEELKHTHSELYGVYKKSLALAKSKDNEMPVDHEQDDLSSLIEQFEYTIGLKFDPLSLDFTDSTYQLFRGEVQDMYFHDVENRTKCDRHAQFLCLARLASRNEERLRIVTTESAFQRIANAQIFLIPQQRRTRYLPAHFDIFTDLAIHARLREDIEKYFILGDYPTAVFQAVQIFRDMVREVSKSTSGKDGGQLIDEVFSLFYNKDGISKLSPILINDIKTGDDKQNTYVNEHDGYYKFAQGIVKAIRNPEAHKTASDPFIQERFSDERTAIKIVGFISWMCERLDKRFSPRS